MSLTEKILPHYTYEDRLHWEDVWELIDGHPIAMSPSPIPKHQRAAAEFITELTFAIRQSNCKECRVYDSLDYRITADTVLVPDILIICGKVAKNYLDFPPSVVVEILSPATALRDRHIKYQLYQQQGVPNYIIADPDKQIIEVFKLVKTEYLLTENNNGYNFVLSDHCTISPDFSNIFKP